MKKALLDAQEQNKLLFVDFWTPYCSICKSNYQNNFKNSRVTQLLNKHYIILSVDASDAPNRTIQNTQKQNMIHRVAPKSINYRPKTKQELKRWQVKCMICLLNKLLPNLLTIHNSHKT